MVRKHIWVLAKDLGSNPSLVIQQQGASGQVNEVSCEQVIGHPHLETVKVSNETWVCQLFSTEPGHRRQVTNRVRA